jgi:hypothetical protein
MTSVLGLGLLFLATLASGLLGLASSSLMSSVAGSGTVAEAVLIQECPGLGLPLASITLQMVLLIASSTCCPGWYRLKASSLPATSDSYL